MQKRILCIDDEPNNLHLLRLILKDRYQLYFAPDGQKGIEAARKHLPDLILSDVSMPGMDGFSVCERLKADSSTRAIPIIFVTANGEIEDETHGFDVGAVDYIQKPVSEPVVLRRVQTHLSLVKAQELEDSQKAAIFMLGEAGHYNDTDTGVHIWRMASYSRALAAAAGWPDDMLDRLELAAPMHDTGKIGIPDAVLKAPRKLDEYEWAIMRQHAEIGFNILSKSDTPIFKMAAEIARFHHEKWDGSGYPRGLIGEAIPESARIVAIADVFDALTMKRPYKDAWPIEDAMAEIARIAGSHLEPRLVALFQGILPTILEIKDYWAQKESV